AFESDFEPAKLIDILRVPVATRKILSLQEFLRIQEPSDLDMPSRLVYRAYSFAFVNFLTDTPERRRQLTCFIADLPSASNGPVESLQSHFPDLLNMRNVEEKWTAYIVR